jgi:ketosteroid isomerase-like protein
MTHDEAANIETIKAYLAALAAGAVGEDLARFFASDALQIEFPNKLNPKGGESDLETLLRRAEQGRGLLASQTFDVHSVVARGDQVSVEAKWSGTLAVSLGALSAGSTMKAHFAMFFELANGRIRRQRNYDCFESW